MEVTTVKNIVKHEQLTNILAYMTFAYVKHEKQETIKVKLEKKTILKQHCTKAHTAKNSDRL